MADADEELVLQCQKGEAAAFETLIRNHQRMVHSLTYRMTGSAADAEDLAQETFLRAYEQIGSFRGASKFSTWLYRIAVNTCLNWRVSEARRFRLQTECAGERPASETFCMAASCERWDGPVYRAGVRCQSPGAWPGPPAWPPPVIAR